MNRTLLISGAIISILVLGFVAYRITQPESTLGATPPITTFQGGTGSSSPSGILYGDGTIRLSTVVVGNNLTFSGGTLSAGVFGKSWEIINSFLSPTTSIAIKVDGSASSTFSNGLEIGTKIASPYFIATSTTATSTFKGDINNSNSELVAHVVRADSSDGTQLKSNSGVPVAVLGTANTSNSLFYGGVNIDGATRLATSLSGFLKATAGAISTAVIDLTTDITGVLPILNGGTNATRLSKSLLWFNGSAIEATSSQVTVGSINSTTTATSTYVGGISTADLVVTNRPTFTGLVSGLVLTNAQGATNVYGGTSCTNQFPRSLSASGSATCATVANTDLANSSLTVTAGNGLTGGGAVSLGSSVTLNSPWSVSGNTISSTTVATTTLLFGGLQVLGLQTNYVIATGTATSTFAGGLEATQFGATTGTSTFRGLSVLTGGVKIPTIASCSQALETDANGSIVCGTDQNSGGTVTQIIAGLGLTGGTITTSGTINSPWSVSGNAISSTTVATTSLLFGGIQTLQLLTNYIEATSTVGTSTFSHGVSVTALGATATSSFKGLQVMTGGIKSNLVCSGTTDLLQTNANGDFICGTDDSSGGLSGGSVNAMTFWTSASAISATSAPTVDFIFATSTATSTFRGGISSLRDFTGTLEATSTVGFNYIGSYLGQGTTSPFSFYSLQAPIGGSYPLFTVASSSNAIYHFSIANDGRITVGTTTATSTQSSKFTIWDEQTSGRTAFNIVKTGSTTLFSVPNTITGTSTFYHGLQALQMTMNAFFATSSNATSTVSGGLTANSLTVTKRPTFSGITSALILTGAQGQTSAYAGSAPCTNQVALSLSATGVISCSSITDAMFSGALAYAHGGTGSTQSFPNNSIIATQGTAFQATSTQPLWIGSLTGTTTATSSILGGFGVATSSPWSKFTLGSGALTVNGNIPATSTVMILDVRTANQFTVQLGNAAMQINMRGYQDGSQWRVLTCNSNAGTAGAVTWLATTTGTAPEGIAWAGGTAPTQTTTAGKCDVWSFIASYATSTLKQGVRVFGAQSASF